MVSFCFLHCCINAAYEVAKRKRRLSSGNISKNTVGTISFSENENNIALPANSHRDKVFRMLCIFGGVLWRRNVDVN